VTRSLGENPPSFDKKVAKTVAKTVAKPKKPAKISCGVEKY
jgi:hypothetical protein